MKILIIDSQENDASSLQHLLQAVNPEIEVVDILTSVEQSVRWLISRNQPELIFLDVQLDDGVSFDIFQEVKTIVPLVFTTRNLAWAVKGYALNAIGYLLKPVEKNALISVLYKHKALKAYWGAVPSPEGEPKYERHSEVSPTDEASRFLIYIGDKIRSVTVDEIAWFKADGNFVYLVTKSDDRLIVNRSLEEIMEVLDRRLFFRLNRTYICYLKSLKDIRKYFNGRIKITLDPLPGSNEEVLVSRSRAHEFLNWLGFN